jgi:hypothetical protein
MDLGSTNGTFLNVSGHLLVLVCAFQLLLTNAYGVCMRFVIVAFLDRKQNSYLYLNDVRIYLTNFRCCGFPQSTRIEAQRYHELREKDTIKFGNSRSV